MASHASQLAPWLDDPKILFSRELTARFAKGMPKLEHNAMYFINGAQHALIDAVHESQLLIAALVILVFWLV